MGREVENEEILTWVVKTPDNVKIEYSKSKELVTIADIVREEAERILRERMSTLPRKKAFEDEELQKMLADRMNGMSIRQLAFKYKKSKSTIEKYLKTDTHFFE